MESWMVSAILATITYIAMFVTYKNKTDTHTKSIDELKSKIEKTEQKTDNNRMDISSLNTQLTTVPTTEHIRQEFVSKELFQQMKEHIDEKFDKLENGISKILDKLNKD